MAKAPESTDLRRRTRGAPCWRVTFTSTLSDDVEGYEATAARMIELAARQAGFLGVETHRDDQGRGVTVSDWASRAAIEAWAKQPEHRAAKAEGKQRWYADWSVRIERIDPPDE